jgi:hypothetical protein
MRVINGTIDPLAVTLTRAAQYDQPATSGLH